MAVRDLESVLGGSAHFCCISGYLSYLFYCIDDLGSGFLLIQVIPCMAPAVLGIQALFFSIRLSVCLQLHLDLVRSQTVLVIAVIPCLGDLHAGLSRGIAVGDVISFHGGGISFYLFFLYGIIDQVSIFKFVKACKAVVPSVIFCHSLGLFELSICKKFHDDAAWTLAVLVVCIIPGLSSTDIDFFRCLCAIRNLYSSRFFLITRETIFVNFSSALINIFSINGTHSVIIHI